MKIDFENKSERNERVNGERTFFFILHKDLAQIKTIMHIHAQRSQNPYESQQSFSNNNYARFQHNDYDNDINSMMSENKIGLIHCRKYYFGGYYTVRKNL